MKVLFLKGIQASGKSTYGKAFCEKNTNWVRVNRDSLRNMRGRYWLPKQERLISKWEQGCILDALRANMNVIVDAMNLNLKYYNKLRKAILIEFPDVKIESKIFDVSLNEAIKRDLKRENSVGKDVITSTYNKYIKVKNVPKLEQNPDLPHVIIVDIDGTIAHHNNKRSPYDGTKVDGDEPDNTIITLIEQYLYSFNSVTDAPTTRVVFLSGREDSCKGKTIEWIKGNTQLKRNEWEIHLRKTGDNRKDCIIKKELFEKYVKDKYYVDFVLDDRNKIVQLWRSLGLKCLQVQDGDF